MRSPKMLSPEPRSSKARLDPSELTRTVKVSHSSGRTSRSSSKVSLSSPLAVIPPGPHHQIPKYPSHTLSSPIKGDPRFPLLQPEPRTHLPVFFLLFLRT